FQSTLPIRVLSSIYTFHASMPPCFFSSSLFPYTTLFRSSRRRRRSRRGPCGRSGAGRPSARRAGRRGRRARRRRRGCHARRCRRSEEHTSELQSREKLVCRLLPEKKNKVWLSILRDISLT